MGVSSPCRRSQPITSALMSALSGRTRPRPGRTSRSASKAQCRHHGGQRSRPAGTRANDRRTSRPGCAQAGRARPCRVGSGVSARRLHHLLAVATGLLQARGLHHLQLCGDEVEDLGDVLTNQAQRPPALRTGVAWIKNNTLARRRPRYARLAAAPSRPGVRLFTLVLFGLRRGIGRCHGDLEVLEGKLRLLDIALDLLRARPELLLFKPCNADLQCLDKCLIGAFGRGKPGNLLVLGDDNCLQRRGVIGK